MRLKWEILDETSFQDFVGTLIQLEGGTRFSRKGRDWGIDAAQENTVYQAKFHSNNNMDKTIREVKNEIKKIVANANDEKWKELWKGKTKYVMVSNIRMNPNDKNKKMLFESNIPQEFRNIGIEKLEIWTLEDLEFKLLKHPFLRDEYFGSGKRFIIPLDPKSFDMEEGSPIREFYDFPFNVQTLVGRKEEIRRIEKFLSDDSRRLLAIEGEGGIGKTKLLIEAGRKATEKGNVPVWLELVSAPTDWHTLLSNDEKILYLVDEPEDYSVIEKIFLGTKNKIIYTTRSYKQLTYSRKQSRLKLHTEKIELKNLTSNEIKSLITKIDLREDLLTNLDQILDLIEMTTKGYPGWIILYIFTLGIKNEHPALTIEELSEMYLIELFANLKDCRNKEDAKKILNSIAIMSWVQDVKELKFVNPLGYDFGEPSEIEDCFLELERAKIIKVFGKRNKRYSVVPQIIADQILIKILIWNDQPSEKSMRVVKGIVELLSSPEAERISAFRPKIERVIENLVRTDFYTNSESEPIVSLLFNELEENIHRFGASSRIELIEILTKFAPYVTDRVLSIARKMMENKAQQQVLKTYLFEQIYDHEKVILEIPWLIYNSSFSGKEFKKILEFLMELIDFELNEFQARLPNDGKRAIDVFPRLLEKVNDDYFGKTVEFACTQIKMIGNSEKQHNGKVYEKLIEPLVKLSGKRTEFIDEQEIKIRFLLVHPEGRRWK